MESKTSLATNRISLLDKSHALWKEHLSSKDLVIDATCGNGHDTLFLASLGVQVIAYDIQEAAIQVTAKRVEGYPNVTLKHASHENFDEQGAKLIVYNLGYLPGSDKKTTTRLESTLRSLESAKKTLADGGALSIICYPGHEEGARESEAVEAWAKAQKCTLTTIRSPSPFLLFLRQFPS
ncbi:MAG: methyltransferase domain-containing protein [Chlamydiales bacterium]|nr:methyltransferase domain-containing protein [Chlamydiales bacterium]